MHIKPNEDLNTEGKGTSDENLEVNAGQPDGSDTSADNNQEGNETTQSEETTDNKATAESTTPADATQTEDEEDDEPLAGDDGEKKFTQTELNKFVKERLKKEKTKFGKLEKDYSAKVTALTTELETYRNEAKAAVKAEFDSLPEEVRELSPASLESAEGIAAIKAWLPKAKNLATKLATPTPETKPEDKKTPGNGVNPKPNGVTPSAEDLKDKARKHSIYASF